MLRELSIRNLAVIEYVHLQFRHGFHVLTGETGAGKSIIIDALSLIVGGRGSSDLVRHGCEKIEIEAMFELEASHPIWTALHNMGIEIDPNENLIIRREITNAGKSTGRINGQLVNLSMLRDAGEWLVNIHGQHEHQSLLRVDQHIHWLDAFGDSSMLQVKKQYQQAYETYIKILKELNQLLESANQSMQMLDLYKFQIEEIQSAKLKIGEEETLKEERMRLANAEKLSHHASQSYDLLYGGQQSLDALGKAIQHLRDIQNLDPTQLSPLLEQAESAYYQLEDVAHQLRDYNEEIEFNPTRLQQIEQRLDQLHHLRRKYGEQIVDVISYLAKITTDVENMEHKDERIQQMQLALAQEQIHMTTYAEQLSTQRKHIAERLARSIEQELRDLQMERTQFVVQVSQIHDPQGLQVNGMSYKFNREGIDQVEFMMAPNPGEPLRPLSKIASGGELSRIMLGLKVIFAKIDQIPVLVFDEVDTGVSGRAAQAIAEKCALLSRSCQVFSITHLPQVACMADAHYLIHKHVEHERTYTQVQDLQANTRVSELARMLGGVEITSTTLQHAQEMIDLANDKKSKLLASS